jgi:hypothetical protein
MATYTLTGSGIQAISAPGCLAIVVTVFPTAYGAGNASPSNWYDLGLLRVGNAQGYLSTVPIDATNLLLPCPAAATHLGYSLKPGVTITAEERAEIPFAGRAAAAIVPNPHVLSTLSRQSLGQELSADSSVAPGTAAWVGANGCALIPLRLENAFTSTNGFFVVGTATAGNYDLGVYDDSFNLLAHTGSTAVPAINVMATPALAVTLAAGRYWLALAFSSGSVQVVCLSQVTAARARIVGARLVTTNFPLATLPTVVAYTVNAIPLFGIADYAL